MVIRHVYHAIKQLLLCFEKIPMAAAYKIKQSDNWTFTILNDKYDCKVTMKQSDSYCAKCLNMYSGHCKGIDAVPIAKICMFSKGIHICFMKSLIIMFPVLPIWFQDPILKMVSSNQSCRTLLRYCSPNVLQVQTLLIQWIFYQSKNIRITRFPENIVSQSDNTTLLTSCMVLSVSDWQTDSFNTTVKPCSRLPPPPETTVL